MKRLIALLTRNVVKRSTPQQELIDYVKNKENLKKAAEGSMQKRIDLINRVELSQAHCAK
jgi:hypothetical protein